MENSKRNIMILAGVGLVFIASVMAFIRFGTGGNDTYQYAVSTKSGTIDISATGVVETEATSMLAYISELSGNVKKTSAKGAYFLKESGEVLAVGDTVKTGDDGMATITFADNSVVRLNNNSAISFQKLAKNDTLIELKNGEIWARVLKPLYDTSFFAIDTGDLSAGVRGTSLSMTKKGDRTQIEVIDSFAETEEKRGVIVRYKNPKTSESVEERIQPEKRLILNTGKTPTIIKQDIKVDEIYADAFKRQSTQKDIILMDHLQKTSSGSKNLEDKISWELAVTLPKWTEIQRFFAEGVIRTQIASMTGAIKPEDIILGTKKEVYVTTLRTEAEQAIDLLQKEATPATQKATEEKKASIRKEMEKTIDGVIKARNIDPILDIKPNTILRNNGEESEYLSGGVLIDISDKQVKNRIDVHIEEEKQQKKIKLQEILKPVSIEDVTETGTVSAATGSGLPMPKMPTSEVATPLAAPMESKVSLPVPPLPRPSVSGEVQIAPRPSVSGELIH